MNDASLTLWLTLDNASWDARAPLTELAMRQLADPQVDPNFVFEDKPLLLVACKRLPVLRDLPADHPNGALPRVLAPVTELLDMGADPWLPVTVDRHTPVNQINTLPQRGLAPLLELLRADAWPVIDRLLAHPRRPSWAVLFTEMAYPENPILAALDTKPEALPLFLRHGLDPNLRIGSLPLVFKVKRLETAQRLVAAGADPTVTSDEGLSLFTHREKAAVASYSPLSAEDRAGWTKLMGHAGIQPEEVFKAALTGSAARVKPLFRTTSEMKEWSWRPDQGEPLTVLDGALYGQLRSSNATASAANLFLKAKTYPVSSDQDAMAWLLTFVEKEPDHQTPEVTDRLIQALDVWLAMDRRMLALGLAGQCDTYVGSAQKLFRNLLFRASQNARAEALLDRWTQWHLQEPARWKQGTSLLSDFLAPGWTLESCAHQPRHQVVWCGLQLRAELSKHSSLLATPCTPEQKDEARRRVMEKFESLMLAHQAAGDAFPESGWKGLWRHLQEDTHLGATLNNQRIAWMRERQAADQAPAPRRPRMRT